MSSYLIKTGRVKLQPAISSIPLEIICHNSYAFPLRSSGDLLQVSPMAQSEIGRNLKKDLHSGCLNSLENPMKIIICDNNNLFPNLQLSEIVMKDCFF